MAWSEVPFWGGGLPLPTKAETVPSVHLFMCQKKKGEQFNGPTNKQGSGLQKQLRKSISIFLYAVRPPDERVSNICNMSNIKLNNLLKTIQTLASGILVKPSTTATMSTSSAHAAKHSYKRSTAPTALPLHKIITTKLFPLSTTKSFQHWSSRKELDRAQEELLKLLPFYNQMDHVRTSKVIKTDVGNGNYINEFMIYPKDADMSKLNHFVLIHGYGAGLGFYLKNFDAISSSKNWCIHALDLLGYGCSSRPHFDDSIPLQTYFVDSLETWRQKTGVDSMLMCSHSLGAYMSLLYTLKYPNHVKKMLCISPAGIYKQPAPPGAIPVWFDWLWEQNISPFSLVRNAGPFGSMVTSGWTSRRFAKLTQQERDRLHTYTYAIFNARGSGEYYMPQVLGAGGVAKVPLVERAKDFTCDVSWVYGDEDWMPAEGGEACTKIINEQTSFDSECVVMENCGHHIYLDNYHKFNEYVLQEMRRYESKYTLSSNERASV